MEINATIIHQACLQLKNLLSKNFGPNGQKTMLCSSAGKMHITSSSSTILSAVELGHPVATLIVKSARRLHTLNGDGCLSLILLLEAVFYQLKDLEDVDVIAISRVLAMNRKTLLHDMTHAIQTSDICSTDAELSQSVAPLIQTNLTSYPSTCSQHLAQLVAGVIQGDSCRLSKFIDHYMQLCVIESGPTTLSRTLSGILTHRDLADVCRIPATPMRFIVIDFDVDDIPLSQTQIQLGAQSDVKRFIRVKSALHHKLLKVLKQLNIQLVLSVSRINDSFRHGLLQQGIHVVHHIESEVVELISFSFNKYTMHSFDDVADIEAEKFIASASVERLLVNGRYQLLLRHPSISSLVLYALTAGQGQQLRSDLLQALTLLNRWMQSNCALVPGGGTCEALLSRLMRDHASTTTSHHMKKILSILSNAYQSIPYQLILNSFRKNPTLADFTSKCSSLNHRILIDAASGDVMPSSCHGDVVEPLCVKMSILEQLLELCLQLLRIRSLVSVRKISPINSDEDSE